MKILTKRKKIEREVITVCYSTEWFVIVLRITHAIIQRKGPQ